MTDATDDDRAARRAYIRDHHPDRGGDPDEFVAGLRRWDGGRRTPPGEPIVIRRSRRRRLLLWWRRRRSPRRHLR
ncbi:hypothetical protein [Nakamurella sp.]|uniref:hypothetical protein n=1 Tax=Nakamurella sp. TaxID=1869182 RepID=UPI003B3A7F9E